MEINKEMIEEAAKKIANLGLSVRQAELLCKNMEKAPHPEKPVTLAIQEVADGKLSASLKDEYMN